MRVAVGDLRRFLERDQLGDGIEVEAELPGMGDEGQSIQFRVPVPALTPPSVRPGSGRRPRPS